LNGGPFGLILAQPEIDVANPVPTECPVHRNIQRLNAVRYRQIDGARQSTLVFGETMNKVIQIGGEKAVIAFDPEIQMLRGKFVGLNGGADFYAESIPDLIEEGRKSLVVYLEMCREKGIEPNRNFSGKFNVRLDPGDHAAAMIAAAAAGKSPNEWIVGAIRDAAESGNLAA